MFGAGLLETTVALAVNALVVSIAVAQIAVAASLERTLRGRTAATVELRLVEHLIDSALDDAAGAAALAAYDAAGFEVHVDRNGDGAVAMASDERLRVLVRDDGRDRVRLLHGLGRQKMTVAAGLDAARIHADAPRTGVVALVAQPAGAPPRRLAFTVVRPDLP